MDLSEYLPFWKHLDVTQQQKLTSNTQVLYAKRGTKRIGNDAQCLGLLIIQKGRIRVSTCSPSGKEITLYILQPYDMCLFAASCLMKGIRFDVSLEAKSDVTYLRIDSSAYHDIMHTSLAAANYTNELMAERFSDVMEQMEAILYQKIDERIANYIVMESQEQENLTLIITHEQIANHIGSAREVVSRILKYLEKDEYIHLQRGRIRILDLDRLTKLGMCSTM